MRGRSDVRLRALGGTALAVVILGLVVTMFSGSRSTPSTVPSSVGASHGRSEAPASTHAREMRAREIAERFGQATAMLHARQYDYAVIALHRLLQLSPKMQEAHVNMGFAMLGQGQDSAARDFFHSAIALRPGQANAYYGLAAALERLCDLPGAIGAMRTYLHLSPDDDRFLGKARAALWEWEVAADGKDEDSTVDNGPFSAAPCHAALLKSPPGAMDAAPVPDREGALQGVRRAGAPAS